MASNIVVGHYRFLRLIQFIALQSGVPNRGRQNSNLSIGCELVEFKSVALKLMLVWHSDMQR